MKTYGKDGLRDMTLEEEAAYIRRQRWDAVMKERIRDSEKREEEQCTCCPVHNQRCQED